MKYLLDTHILIWVLTDNPKLNSAIRVILADETNEFFLSTESIREMILKAKTGKLTLPADIDSLLFELADPLEILYHSLDDTGWKIDETKSAGFASQDNRQSVHINTDINSPREEYDVWATWRG